MSLATIRRTTIIVLISILTFLVVYLIARERYKSSDDPVIKKIQENFSRIDPRYANIPIRTGSSAYTENKEIITLCLKDPDTGEYYDMNTLMYVSLHELAHVVSKTHGHDDTFKKNFEALLKRASLLGIYDPRKKIPSSYCNVKS